MGGEGEKVGALSLVPLTETRYLTPEGEREAKRRREKQREKVKRMLIPFFFLQPLNYL